MHALRRRLTPWLGLLLASCAGRPQPVPVTAALPAPPLARVAPVELTAHGRTRSDEYYWLRERDDPAVRAYLEAENTYAGAVMAHTAAFQDSLFEEIRGRVKEDDSTAPYLRLGYYYYRRYEEDREYPLYCRRPGSLEAAEQVMLDGNALARGHGFCQVGDWEVSPGGRWLAYAVDTDGRRIHAIRFRDLQTGQDLADELPATTDNLVWAEDDRTLLYTRQEPETLRWYRVYRHRLGADPAADMLVYEEPDSTFDCYVYATKSRRYLMIESSQTLSSECRYLEADRPEGEFRVFEPRRRDHEYHVDHCGDWFYVRSNDQASNFRIMRTPVEHTGRARWEEVIPHREDVLVEGFELFRDYLVVEQRCRGLSQLLVHPWSGAGEHYLDFGEPAYLAYTRDNYEPDTGQLRFVYTSMTTPRTVYDYDMATRSKTLIKRDEVLGGFDPAHYVTERLYAPARDGAEVPISLAYRRDRFHRDGTRPLLLYGYGSYGISSDAEFYPEDLSLIDRGFVYAIAHVRGGQELGRGWYEDGKLLHKKNTFTDFIDCAEYLVAQRYADPRRLFCHGISAGGLLIGAVINMRPELFAGAVADVPFVDVVTTMLDEDIPLTTAEYDEWGNPHEEEYYRYMLSYSPYDNVEARAYPHLLVTTSLQDSQVQYWEPAKWVARLRARKTGGHRLLLRTQMEAGHGGVSGRYRRYRELAFHYAFLLDLAGRAE